MKKFVLFLSLCIVSVSAISQSRVVYGYAVDKSSNEIVKGMRASLLRPDSTVIDTFLVKDGGFNGFISSAFKLKAPQFGKYIVRCTSFGYNAVYKDIDIRDSKRNHSISMGTFYLTRDKHVLNEVVVTATKIKMVVKGDTVVYNAGAFQLAEGSMLDALVKQLPGVELKKDGRITVNGKFVESLYVNGKDFFSGGPKMALENLPSYMVNKVKIYNKKDELTGVAVKKKDEHLIMDVNLKKQYSVGIIANIGAGRGTNERYTGRFFGLRFASKSRLSVMGNINNMNDSQQPGEDIGELSPAFTGGGLQSLKSGGLSYRYDSGKEFYIQSDNTINRTDNDNQYNTITETFLTSENAFAHSLNKSRMLNTNFNSMNMMNYHTDRFWMRSSLTFNCSRDNTHSKELSGNFSSNPLLMINGNVLDSLFAFPLNRTLRQITLNRRSQDGMGNGHQLSTTLGASCRLLTDQQTKDGLSIDARFTYSSSTKNNFSQSFLDYPSNPTAAADNRNQYTHAPTRSYNLSVNSFYEYFLRNDMGNNRGDKIIMLSPGCEFKKAYNSSRSSLYRLDKLSGWERRQLGLLPSTNDSLLMAIDAGNSYFSNRHETIYNPNIRGNVLWSLGMDSISQRPGLIGFDFGLGGSFSRKSMNYYRGSKFFPISRRDFLFEPNINFTWMSNRFGDLSLGYQLSSSSPELTNLVNITDNVDPLNVMLGNPDLKNSHSHNIHFSYMKFQMEHARAVNVNIGYHIDQNAVAMGFVYDKTTGIRTSKPENVNGNWGINANLSYNGTIDRKGYLTLSNNTSADKSVDVDLISIAGASASSRSTVHNLSMTEKLGLDFRRDTKIMLGTQFTCNWNHATSRRDDFNTINAFDFNYGMTGQIELPLEMQFSTDITMFSRRGYQDKQMNTDKLVWNARLSKRLFRGNLILMADGFDILHNLSNVQRILNAQGRTETTYNVVPRYIMLHAVYRFNSGPRK